MEHRSLPNIAEYPSAIGCRERVLITALGGNDAEAITALLKTAGLNPEICEDPAECARQINNGAGALLLTEEALEHVRFPELLNFLEAQPPWSDLPVIILTSGGEERLQRLLEVTAPVARMATLLERPISDATLIRSVEVALNSRVRQYQVRDVLEERERFRNQVILREYQLRFMVDNAADFIVYCDAEGRYLFCNVPYAERFGLRPEDVLGKHISEVVGAAAYENFRHHVEAVLCGERVDFEQKIPYAAIGPRCIHAVYVPQFIGNDVVGFVAQIKDITVQKEAEEAGARLAAIVASSSDAIVSKTLEGIVTSWNAGAERMFGYSAQEMIGQHISRLIPDELKGEEDRILASIRAGVRVEHFETERVTKDGRRFPVSLTISPIRDSSGNLIGASKIARDISERRATEERLRLAKDRAEKASRAKDDFLAALSHELRTPLTPALMAATALREDSTLPERVREQLSMIARNVSLEARLIDDLLDLTRVARGKLFLCPEPCDAHALIHLVVEIVRSEAREKQIEIVLDLAARESMLIGDPARLQQAFWNLLQNAVKFTPAGGHVRVHSFDGSPDSGSDQEPRICIQVTDNGIGFPPEAGERIFEPFEQVASKEPYRMEGIGLGLAITRTVVEMHNGVIHAESPGEGLGAIFTVELPKSNMAWVESELPDYSGQPEDRRHERPMRLLVVEDHEPTLQVLARLLTSAGHTVVTASGVAEARRRVSEQLVDFVISDLGLPDGNGIELMRGLRDSYGLRGIALSGFGMEEDLRRSREAGFVEHLVKPVDFNELRRTLSEFGVGQGS